MVEFKEDLIQINPIIHSNIEIDSDNVSYKEPTQSERIQNDIKWNLDSLYRCFGSILALDDANQASLLSDLNQKLSEFQSKVAMIIPI